MHKATWKPCHTSPIQSPKTGPLEPAFGRLRCILTVPSEPFHFDHHLAICIPGYIMVFSGSILHRSDRGCDIDARIPLDIRIAVCEFLTPLYRNLLGQTPPLLGLFIDCSIRHFQLQYNWGCHFVCTSIINGNTPFGQSAWYQLSKLRWVLNSTNARNLILISDYNYISTSLPVTYSEGFCAGITSGRFHTYVMWPLVLELIPLCFYSILNVISPMGFVKKLPPIAIG